MDHNRRDMLRGLGAGVIGSIIPGAAVQASIPAVVPEAAAVSQAVAPSVPTWILKDLYGMSSLGSVQYENIEAAFPDGVIKLDPETLVRLARIVSSGKMDSDSLRTLRTFRMTGKCEFDGVTVYHKNGVRHREDGPAVIYQNGRVQYYQDGLLHREDGPAVVDPSLGTERWYLKGENRRKNGPAVTIERKTKSGGLFRYQEWCEEEFVGRTDGPSIVKEWIGGKLNGTKHEEWYRSTHRATNSEGKECHEIVSWNGIIVLCDIRNKNEKGAYLSSTVRTIDGYEAEKPFGGAPTVVLHPERCPRYKVGGAYYLARYSVIHNARKLVEKYGPVLGRVPN